MFPLLLPGKGFRVFLVRLLSGSARVSPSGFGEYRPRRLTQLTRQCRCAPSKSLSSNQQEKERSTPHFVCGPTGIRNCSTRASTVLHARALSCWPQALTRPGLRHLSESSAMLPIVTSQTLARLYPLYVLCEISKPLSGCGGRIGPDSHAVRVTGDFKAAHGLTTARNGLSAFGGFARLRLTHLPLSGESSTILSGFPVPG